MDILQNETAQTISISPSHCHWVLVNVDVGDPRFLHKEDMDTRFALVVGTCLASSCAMSSMLLLSWVWETNRREM